MTSRFSWAAARVVCAGLALLPWTAPLRGADAPSVKVELNKLEPYDKGCRAYVVVDNQSAAVYQSLKLDLVFFRSDGIIDRRVALDLAPLRANKRSVKLFDLDGANCDKIGSVLVNDVLECKADGADVPDCLDRLSVTSRAGAQLTK